MTRKRDKQPRGPEHYLTVSISLSYNETDERLTVWISGYRPKSDNWIANNPGGNCAGLPARHQLIYPDTAGRGSVEAEVFAALAPWLDKIVPQDDAASEWE